MNARDLIVRHFRQICVWPLQLMPLRPGQQVQRHWEALESIRSNNHWREVVEKFADPAEFHERHYKEFVTFLPYVQRFLYGSTAGQEASNGQPQGSMRVFRRDDVAGVRIVFAPGEAATLFRVQHVSLYFFLDADIANFPKCKYGRRESAAILQSEPRRFVVRASQCGGHDAERVRQRYDAMRNCVMPCALYMSLRMRPLRLDF